MSGQLRAPLGGPPDWDELLGDTADFDLEDLVGQMMLSSTARLFDGGADSAEGRLRLRAALTHSPQSCPQLLQDPDPSHSHPFDFGLHLTKSSMHGLVSEMPATRS